MVVILAIAWFLAVSNTADGATAGDGGPRAGADRSATPTRRFLFLAAVGAAVGFALAWGVVDWLAIGRVYGSVDSALSVGPYPVYGASVLAGRFPYGGFELDYPPLSLPAFVVPALLSHGAKDAAAYWVAFQALMLVCGMVMAPLVVNIASSLGGGRRDLLISAGFVAASPLLVGAVMLSRFDLWPTVLMAASLAAILKDRYRIGFALLGLGILAKDYPALLVPVSLSYVWNRRGRPEATRCLLIVAGVTALGFAPFLWLAGGGAITGLAHAVERPLQIETLGAALLVLAHDATWLPLNIAPSYGSDNLAGRLPDALALGQSVLLLVALLLTWIGFARGPAEPRRLAVSVAASLAAYVALGKVLSPQYLIWLIPTVAVLRGTRGRIAIAGLAALLLLTTIEWPGLYPDYVSHFAAGPAVLILVRDLGLCVLAGFLVAQVRGVRWLRAWRRPTGSRLTIPPAVEVTVSEAVSKTSIAQGAGSTGPFVCDGSTTHFTIPVQSFNVPFKGGKALVQASAEADWLPFDPNTGQLAGTAFAATNSLLIHLK